MFVDLPECASYQTEEFIQIGHGGPGMLIGLLAVHPISQILGHTEMCTRIDQAVDNAQEVIWERGLLTTEPCPQHGAPGNSLVLLDRRRKATFPCERCAEVTRVGLEDGSLDPSSSPIGLHRGLMGTIWAMCEFQAGRSGVMPTFNEL
jgi:hypothetical protein